MSLHQVPVAGGTLAVEVHDGSTRPVLAIHGISSQRRLWDWLLVESPHLHLVAPDLRGRGDSIDVAGPAGVDAHVEDLLAALDHLGLDRVVVVGMSMGGFIALELAHRAPERVESLVLVDGGFPFSVPAGLTREALPVVFADRLGRLDQQWGSVEDYLAFFTSSTAPLLDADDPVLRGYLAHDLDDQGRVRLSGEALLDDAASIYFGDLHNDGATQPIRWTYAEWGAGPDSAPMYPADLAADYAARTVEAVYLPGLDHAGAIMTKAGAVATAELLAKALA
jgi:pimeloyl-ACP methyl ester carboxylesterase